MRKRRFIIRLTLQVLGAQCMMIGGLAVLLWLLGRVLSDRSAFSQWLLWIPTLAMAPAVALGLICSLAPVRKPVLQRRRFWVWAIAALGIAAFFCFVEHRLLTPAPAAGRGLSIAGWTMTFHPANEQRPEVADRVVEHLGDLAIITEGWFLHQNNLLRSRLSDDVLLHRVHPFTIVSRLPLIESRPIEHAHLRGYVFEPSVSCQHSPRHGFATLAGQGFLGLGPFENPARLGAGTGAV